MLSDTALVATMWDSYIKPALSAFATVAQWVAAIVLTVLIDRKSVV